MFGHLRSRIIVSFFALMAITGAPMVWVVMTTVARPAADKVLFTMAMSLITGVAGITLLAFVVTRPLSRLRSAMRAVGHGDLQARAGGLDDKSPPDELSDLGREFDAMASRLAAALGELALERQRLERELAERKALESSLVESERLAALGVLASCVAHEVGNPLASIGTAVQGLLRRLNDPDHPNHDPNGPSAIDPIELKEYLEIVEKQVLRCRGVTTRLLGLARVPAKTESPVDVALAVRDVLALVRPQARAQNVSIEISLSEPVIALAEDLLVGQTLLNMVLNALQAMPDGGTLTVKAGTDSGGKQVFVTVRDTGRGIPPAMRDRLFEPFQTARENGTGTGLGLFLTRMLLEQCGGSISVESGENGTAFTACLAAPASP